MFVFLPVFYIIDCYETFNYEYIQEVSLTFHCLICDTFLLIGSKPRRLEFDSYKEKLFVSNLFKQGVPCFDLFGAL